jgi:hypothetical protein
MGDAPPTEALGARGRRGRAARGSLRRLAAGSGSSLGSAGCNPEADRGVRLSVDVHPILRKLRVSALKPETRGPAPCPSLCPASGCRGPGVTRAIWQLA